MWVQTGTYEIIVELYDSSANVIYSGTDTVSIVGGSNSKTVQIEKNIASLSITGSWSETVDGLDTAIVELKQNSTITNTRMINLDVTNKQIQGIIDNIYPNDYELYIKILDNNGAIILDGNQPITVVKGTNSINITLELKIATLVIQIAGDVTAPFIVNGPFASVFGQDVTIEWETNEPATSNVCYSTTSGFDYQTTINWAPLAGDSVANLMIHTINLTEMPYNTYYYVIASADECGNMFVSDEYSFTVTESTSINTWQTVSSMPT